MKVALCTGGGAIIARQVRRASLAVLLNGCFAEQNSFDHTDFYRQVLGDEGGLHLKRTASYPERSHELHDDGRLVTIGKYVRTRKCLSIALTVSSMCDAFARI